LVAPSSLWTTLLAKVEASGVDCDVALHTLALGAEDGENGQYGLGFLDSTISMVIEPDNTQLKDVAAGTHGQLHATAYCIDLVSDGDRVTDSFGNVWRVTTSHHAPVGDVITHYQLDLELMIADTGSNLHPPPAVDPKHSGFAFIFEAAFASPAIESDYLFEDSTVSGSISSINQFEASTVSGSITSINQFEASTVSGSITRTIGWT
jgi:hypothetical protein